MHLLYNLWITQPATVKTDTIMDVKNSLLKTTVKIPELVSPTKILSQFCSSLMWFLW